MLRKMSFISFAASGKRSISRVGGNKDLGSFLVKCCQAQIGIP